MLKKNPLKWYNRFVVNLKPNRGDSPNTRLFTIKFSNCRNYSPINYKEGWKMFPVDPPISFYVIIHSIRYQQYHVGNFGSISLFECSKPKEMMLTIHRLYKNNQEAQERIRKIRELGYKNTSAIDLGNDGIRIQEIWCHECILNLKSVSKVNSK